MDLSVLFLFLGIFCWGTVVYLENSQITVKSWKTVMMLLLLIFSLSWLVAFPVDWSSLIGVKSVAFGWRSLLNYLGTLSALWGGILVVAYIFYPLSSFIFRCEMDEVLKKILS